VVRVDGAIDYPRLRAFSTQHGETGFLVGDRSKTLKVSLSDIG